MITHFCPLIIDRPAIDRSRVANRAKSASTQKIAADLDQHKFGVKAFYLIGGTKNATAGLASDIDILLHFQGNKEQMKELLLWFDGWSRCLAEINFLRAGYRTDGLLDVHLATDTDIGTSDLRRQNRCHHGSRAQIADEEFLRLN